MLVTMGEGTGTPTEFHHTPSPEAQQTSLTATSSPSLPPVTTTTIPTVILTDTPQLRKYTRRDKIAQSLVLPTVADEPESLLRDDSQDEACLTVSGLEDEQDRANITKTSTLPSDSTPRVTSLVANEGSMQQQLNELMDLCTRLQRQQDEMASKITAQDLEFSKLKARVKLLEDKDGGAVERGSEDIEEMVTVLTSLEAVSILTSGVSVSISPVTEVSVAEVPIGSGSIPISSPPGTGVPTVSVPTGSDVVPTASPIFTTATVATPYIRRKGKENMVESETPKKKKLQEQMDMEMARQIHAEEELLMTIDGLDMSNEMIAKHLHEYDQAAVELTIGEKIELINELVKYQDHFASILKYKAQQSKPLSKKQQREFYMSILRSHAEQDNAKKVKTSEEILEEDLKAMMQKWLGLEQDNAKKVKTSEEISEEDLKAMMQLVLVEEVYVEALQVKHPIIHWEIQTEGQRSYWKLIRLGGSTTSYQFFVDMLKHFDREDLNQLWALVKETLNIRQATNDKEKELWVELKRTPCPIKGVLSYDLSFQANEEPTNYALMAFTSSSSSSFNNEIAPCSKACSKAYATFQSHYDKLNVDFRKSQFDFHSYKSGLESVEARLVVYQQNENVFEEDIKLLKLNVMLRDNALVELRKKFEKAKKERDELKHTLEKFHTFSKNISKLIASQITDKTGLGYDNQMFTSTVFDCDELNSSESDVSMATSPVHDRYKSGEGYHVVPSLYTRTFMPPKPDLVFHNASTVSEIVPTVFNVESSTTKPTKDMSQSNRPSAPIIEDWVSDSEDESDGEPMPT
nr:hypothetical protein [Tanacetum cinerariifolium]